MADPMADESRSIPPSPAPPPGQVLPRRARRFRDRADGSGAGADARDLALLVVPSALAVAALLLASGGAGWRSGPWSAAGWVELAVWCLLSSVAALHQPLPPHRAAASVPAVETLGLGAVVLPAVIVRQGALPAALAAAVAVVLAASVRRRALRGVERTPGLLPGIEGALLVAASVLAGGAWIAWNPAATSPRMREWFLVVTSYCLVLLAARVALPAARRRTPARWIDAGAVALDAAGWLVGVLLLSTQTGPATFVLYAAFALLAAEAARHAMLQRRTGRRVDAFDRLSEAHERILGETSGAPAIAQQIFHECRHILPVQWFQLQLADGTSWAAGPDGEVVEGVPEPPPRPSMLPGIHRRARWHRVDVPLVPPVDDGGARTADDVSAEIPAGEAAATDPSAGERSADEAVKKLGMVRLWCDPRRLEEGADDLLWRLVPQMASSLERAQLDREARLDPLTDVPVRRVLEARLHRVYRRACDEGKPLAAIVCDVDHFKRVNDTWGHAAGDEALKRVAAALDDNRRDSDLLCRWGGEEFTLLLEGTDGEQALQLAERLRRGVESIRFVWEGEEIPLTLSLGVAAFPELTVKAPSELFLLADEALYEAKARGRNQSLLHCGLRSGTGAFRAPVSA